MGGSQRLTELGATDEGYELIGDGGGTTIGPHDVLYVGVSSLLAHSNFDLLWNSAVFV